MADELDDIAEESPEGKGKGKKKPAKVKKEADPAAPPPEEKGEKPGKKGKGKASKGKTPKGEKKKGRKILLILIIVLVVLILIAAFCTVVYLNWWGMGDTVLNPISDWLVGVVVWLNPEFRSISQEMRAANEERKQELKELSEELGTREEEVAAREDVASTREVQLDRRGATLDRQEAQLKQQQEQAQPPAFQRDLTEQERADLESLSRTYAQMAPEAAARIIFELYRPEDITTILYFMVERNRAAILSEMPPALAALITEYMIDPVFAAEKYADMKDEYDEIRDSIVVVVVEEEPEGEEEPEE